MQIQDRVALLSKKNSKGSKLILKSGIRRCSEI